VVHLRIVAPAGAIRQTLDVLMQAQSVVNVIHLEDASKKPRGDVVLCDVAREDASVVLADLRALGLAQSGSIAVEEIDTAISDSARAAEAAAAGSVADAVIWEEVEARTSESAELSFSFLAFMVLATLIASAGIMTDSQILIIGAMVVGPEFGPLAGFCVAVIDRRLDLARRSLFALAVGFPFAIVLTTLLTLILRWLGPAPDQVTANSRPATYFIAHPNTFSVVVATLAGVAGMLSLTTAKSGALIGVLISVTTIPAAANVGVAAAYGDWHDFGGALAQLGINLTCVVLSGIATLALLRVFYARRRRRHLERASWQAPPDPRVHGRGRR
jgi:uncharacterized hydrophobic protein (TIGR00271 family)